MIDLSSFFFIFFFQLFYRSSSALHRRSSTEILPDYWGTFCAGVCPKSVFSFLVAAGFEPTSWSLPSGRLNHYPILNPRNPILTPQTTIDVDRCWGNVHATASKRLPVVCEHCGLILGSSFQVPASLSSRPQHPSDGPFSTHPAHSQHLIATTFYPEGENCNPYSYFEYHQLNVIKEYSNGGTK